MKASTKVLSFPGIRKRKKSTSVDNVKYFTQREIKLLRRTVRDNSDLALSKGQVTAIRAWLAVDLLTCTGLRVSECADLQIKHLHIEHGKSEIFVENGKGSVSGTVIIPLSLKKHLKAFICWKKEQGEGIQADDFLFVGQRGKWGSQAIQQTVKKYLRTLGLYENGKSVHALRHSYAVALYHREKDLRTVQKQLRHVSVQSTMVYADVSKDEIAEQVKGLWN
ncbi:MAG: tyrosine-type recombinase/integrase [Desulfobacterales bacterium]|nr:tyrosine-type recombinase/integrase [Desulfobacterales bacterium]